jgi:hypothetical protein
MLSKKAYIGTEVISLRLPIDLSIHIVQRKHGQIEDKTE